MRHPAFTNCHLEYHAGGPQAVNFPGMPAAGVPSQEGCARHTLRDCDPCRQNSVAVARLVSVAYSVRRGLAPSHAAAGRNERRHHNRVALTRFDPRSSAFISGSQAVVRGSCPVTRRYALTGTLQTACSMLQSRNILFSGQEPGGRRREFSRKKRKRTKKRAHPAFAYFPGSWGRCPQTPEVYRLAPRA